MFQEAGVKVSVSGLDVALRDVRKFKSELNSIGKSSSKISLELDTATIRRDLAAVNTAFDIQPKIQTTGASAAGAKAGKDFDRSFKSSVSRISIPGITSGIGASIKGAFRNLPDLSAPFKAAFSAIPTSLNAALRGSIGAVSGVGRNIGSSLLGGFTGTIGGLGNVLRSTLTSVIPLASGIGVAVAAGLVAGATTQQLTKSIQSATAAEAAIGRVASKLGREADEIPELANLFGELALDPNLVVDFQGATATTELLVQQGIEYEDIVNGVLRSTILLQNATGSTPKLAAQTLGSISKQFGVVGDEATGDLVSDLIGLTQTSKLNLNDVRLLFAQGGSVGNVGVELDDILGGAAVAATSASSGSDVGTSQRNFFNRLSGKGKKAREAIDGLGLNFFDEIDGSIRSTQDIADELQRVFSGEDFDVEVTKTVGTDQVLKSPKQLGNLIKSAQFKIQKIQGGLVEFASPETVQSQVDQNIKEITDYEQQLSTLESLAPANRGDSADKIARQISNAQTKIDKLKLGITGEAGSDKNAERIAKEVKNIGLLQTELAKAEAAEAQLASGLETAGVFLTESQLTSRIRNLKNANRELLDDSFQSDGKTAKTAASEIQKLQKEIAFYQSQVDIIANAETITETITRAGLSERERLDALDVIFGADASRFAISLAAGGSEAVAEAQESIAKTDAEEIARIVNEGVAGATEVLTDTYGALRTTFGLPQLNNIERSFRTLADVLAESQPAVRAYSEDLAKRLEPAVDRFVNVTAPQLKNALSGQAFSVGDFFKLSRADIGSPLRLTLADFVTFDFGAGFRQVNIGEIFSAQLQRFETGTRFKFNVGNFIEFDFDSFLGGLQAFRIGDVLSDYFVNITSSIQQIELGSFFSLDFNQITGDKTLSLFDAIDFDFNTEDGGQAVKFGEFIEFDFTPLATNIKAGFKTITDIFDTGDDDLFSVAGLSTVFTNIKTEVANFNSFVDSLTLSSLFATTDTDQLGFADNISAAFTRIRETFTSEIGSFEIDFSGVRQSLEDSVKSTLGFATDAEKALAAASGTELDTQNVFQIIGQNLQADLTAAITAIDVSIGITAFADKLSATVASIFSFGAPVAAGGPPSTSAEPETFDLPDLSGVSVWFETLTGIPLPDLPDTQPVTDWFVGLEFTIPELPSMETITTWFSTLEFTVPNLPDITAIESFLTTLTGLTVDIPNFQPLTNFFDSISGIQIDLPDLSGLVNLFSNTPTDAPDLFDEAGKFIGSLGDARSQIIGSISTLGQELAAGLTGIVTSLDPTAAASALTQIGTGLATSLATTLSNADLPGIAQAAASLVGSIAAQLSATIGATDLTAVGASVARLGKTLVDQIAKVFTIDVESVTTSFADLGLAIINGIKDFFNGLTEQTRQEAEAQAEKAKSDGESAASSNNPIKNLYESYLSFTLSFAEAGLESGVQEQISGAIGKFIGNLFQGIIDTVVAGVNAIANPLDTAITAVGAGFVAGSALSSGTYGDIQAVAEQQAAANNRAFREGFQEGFGDNTINEQIQEINASFAAFADIDILGSVKGIAEDIATAVDLLADTIGGIQAPIVGAIGNVALAISRARELLGFDTSTSASPDTSGVTADSPPPTFEEPKGLIEGIQDFFNLEGTTLPVEVDTDVLAASIGEFTSEPVPVSTVVDWSENIEDLRGATASAGNTLFPEELSVTAGEIVTPDVPEIEVDIIPELANFERNFTEELDLTIGGIEQVGALDATLNLDIGRVEQAPDQDADLNLDIGSVGRVDDLEAGLNLTVASVPRVNDLDAKLDLTLGPVPSVRDQKAKLEFDVSEPPSVRDQTANLNYISRITGSLPADITRTVTYNVAVSGGGDLPPGSGPFIQEALGTSFFPGGLMLSGERGYELVKSPLEKNWRLHYGPTFTNEPKGTVVLNHDRSRQMVNQAAGYNASRSIPTSGASHAQLQRLENIVSQINSVRPSGSQTINMQGGGSFDVERAAVRTAHLMSRERL